MLPRIDYPELLLEVHARTGMFDSFTHITGSHVRRDDLDITLAALTVARSCNVGLIPVIKAGAPALTAARLIGVEKGYFHGEGIAAASARLVDKQAEIDITADWGGELVASVGRAGHQGRPGHAGDPRPPFASAVRAHQLSRVLPVQPPGTGRPPARAA
ncbi:hypothetical protein Ssi03_04220 [Sphaerisporangium siamense]|uniref:Tn3 transposase DDE domain-containing protein n=1 Tax=Sphaerisporangium siamense TaxID=795645 RepID=A0A7W7GCJ5_9ACTN|nr:Tn3 family transposase [Sphaerisporangium siamense]MBB4703960.1 hypothetical protein [Sphaerisporangium siamense]GII82432.1 hypothetical protein Ssi03_04220 [Sphaerisporangium siamense]